MKLLILSLGFAFGITSVASAKTVVCREDAGASAMMTTSFDSTKPSLTELVVGLETDGSVSEAKIDYLSSSLACETVLDFKSECTAGEQLGPNGYSYQFSCKAKKLSGEFYVDENGNGRFSCNNRPASAMFFGCTVQ